MRILIAALSILLLAACGGDKPPAKLNIGDIAPTFQTLRADGTSAQFPAAWAGKPLVIRFWADWCKYCEGEMKDIEKVYQRLKPRGLVGQGLLLLLAGGIAGGIAVGYLLHKHEKEIVLAVSKAIGMGKDFVMQQRENLDDLMAEAKETEAQAATAPASADTPAAE